MTIDAEFTERLGVRPSRRPDLAALRLRLAHEANRNAVVPERTTDELGRIESEVDTSFEVFVLRIPAGAQREALLRIVLAVLRRERQRTSRRPPRQNHHAACLRLTAPSNEPHPTDVPTRRPNESAWMGPSHHTRVHGQF